tara:strand:+ start:2741 stop:3880 length:1140 start_codon:yes stop_codon:yes gene_type:complete
MNKNITYVTYQNFPAETANSIQSISNIIEIVRMGYKLKLIFPNRAAESSDDISVLQNYYNFTEKFEILRIAHILPFGRIDFFNKFSFHISHMMWSFYVAYFRLKSKSEDLYITRSDWIFYFLSRKNTNILFECHAESKLRKILLKSSLKNKNSKVIFVSEALKNLYSDLNISNEQCRVIENGFRSDLFDAKVIKNSKQVIFVGRLLRFEKTRGIEFIIDSFRDVRLKDYSLIVVGGPKYYSDKLDTMVRKSESKNIEIIGHLNQEDTSEFLMTSEIGLMINSNDHINNLKYTFPLKYFEYLAADLKVVGVNFSAHKNLPFSENISFFDYGNKDQFIEAIISANSSKNIDKLDISKYSYKNRVKNIIKFARLEGLEPPTL